MTDKNNESFFDNEFMDTETKDFFENPDNRSDEMPEDSGVKHETQSEKIPEKNNIDDSQSDNDPVDADNVIQNENDNQSQQKMSDQERYRAMAVEERTRRKEIQKQIDTLAQENARLKGTFDKIMQKAQEQAERDSEAQVPSFDENPLEALRHENEQLKKKFGNMEQNLSQREQQEQ